MFGFSLNPIDWVSDAASSVLDGFLDEVVDWVQDGLTYVTMEVGNALAGLSAPDFGSGAFATLGGEFKWLALVAVVATIMGAAGGSLINDRVDLATVVREIPLTMVMLGGWYAVAALWFEGCRALTGAFTGDALSQSLEAGLVLDADIASFFRLLICLLMILFLLVFLVEMFVLQHMMTFAVIVGPLAIALRPWPALKEVSAKMIRNLVALSLTPALTAASMSLALRNLNEVEALDIGKAIAGLAGMVVSVLMPAMLSKFLPLGGSGDSGGRAMIGAAAAVAAGVATLGAGTAAAGAAAAGGGGGNVVGADRLATLTASGGDGPGPSDGPGMSPPGGGPGGDPTPGGATRSAAPPGGGGSTAEPRPGPVGATGGPAATSSRAATAPAGRAAAVASAPIGEPMWAQDVAERDGRPPVADAAVMAMAASRVAGLLETRGDEE